MALIFDAYLKEAKALHAKAREETKKARGSRAFRDVAREVAFARGWELRPLCIDTSDTTEERDFQGIMLALLYVSSVQALHGLEPLGVMVGALEAGWDARGQEAIAVGNAGGDA